VSAARQIVWAAGAPVRVALVGAIRLYRVTLAGWLGGQCRFWPSCSRYAEDAIRNRGAVVGSALSVWRVLRCNPFGAGGLDPAPRREAYEPIIPPARHEGTRA
jgi:putative membrane protein insertion efficiency factor